ncbi:hypothetical protein [Priestia flexa]|uniref:hypothetical protein n=1 Tax=Priestia flexa TaxID=86664 RepID=UPI000474332F|nr:hypothetical protein [Priestia flexa]
MSEEVNEQVLELDPDQLQELIGEQSDTLPPIEIELDAYDQGEFQKGIDETSHLAGVITALLNTGVTEGFVLDYLLNKATIEHNLETAKINKDMNIEMVKHQRVVADKHEL